MAVRLYYLGGLGKPGSDKPVTIQSKGRAVTLPAPGEYIDVDEYTARDLQRRNKLADRFGTHDVFTRNPRIAKAALGNPSAVQNGPRTLDDFSLEEMLEHLREKGVITDGLGDVVKEPDTEELLAQAYEIQEQGEAAVEQVESQEEQASEPQRGRRGRKDEE